MTGLRKTVEAISTVGATRTSLRTTIPNEVRKVIEIHDKDKIKWTVTLDNENPLITVEVLGKGNNKSKIPEMNVK